MQFHTCAPWPVVFHYGKVYRRGGLIWSPGGGGNDPQRRGTRPPWPLDTGCLLEALDMIIYERNRRGIYSKYTMPPSVRILLPSTTSDGQGRDRACLPPALVREMEPRAAPARRCAHCGRDGWQSDGTCEGCLAEAVQARLEEKRHLYPVAQAWDAATAERACYAPSSHQHGRRPAPGAI
jgi:hypothetical protein